MQGCDAVQNTSITVTVGLYIKTRGGRATSVYDREQLHFRKVVQTRRAR
jgi:hypothetical protein